MRSRVTVKGLVMLLDVVGSALTDTTCHAQDTAADNPFSWIYGTTNSIRHVRSTGFDSRRQGGIELLQYLPDGDSALNRYSLFVYEYLDLFTHCRLTNLTSAGASTG